MIVFFFFHHQKHSIIAHVLIVLAVINSTVSDDAGQDEDCSSSAGCDNLAYDYITNGCCEYENATLTTSQECLGYTNDFWDRECYLCDDGHHHYNNTGDFCDETPPPGGVNGDPMILGLQNQVFKFEGRDGAWYSNLSTSNNDNSTLNWNMLFKKFDSCP
eukprot:CAMPEP_0194259840 /NCGR_PEP_ID=MMETSP0158-20130606/44497_1 /TAXON_ID=33649 /ORGANISM="Thalassionema nitzschioides, Strain L26-B" /LENGTH=159 /DNA_ID=CAMNT_0038999785 /DNA_START=171 /DNA_END=646 /DNA_ORIENTATION=+